MSTYSQIAWGLLPIVIAVAFWRGKAELQKERARAKSAFIQDRQEFMSIWMLAHAWAGMEPISRNLDEIPEAVKRVIDKLILAYFRNELTLRARDGYRVKGHHFLERILGFDKEFDKLWVNLTENIDVEFIDSIYVMRSEVLHWCPKEFLEPPACWAPANSARQGEPQADEVDEDMRWHKDLTDLMRRKTACLELARHIWNQEGPLLYEAVRTHPLMRQAGLLNVFSPGAFRNAARGYAPDKVKTGGRPKKSIN